MKTTGFEVKNDGCEVGTTSPVSPINNETVKTNQDLARNAQSKPHSRPNSRVQKDCIQEKVVRFRVSETEYERLKTIADDNALTVSGLARARVWDTKIISKTDAKLTRELSRLGGLIKLYIIVMRDHYGHNFDSTEADKTLSEIRNALAILHDFDPVTGAKS